VNTPIETQNTGLSFDGLWLGRLSAIKEVLTDLKPDVVHLTGPHLWNVLILRWLKGRGIPSIHTLHDLDPHFGTGYGSFLRIWNNLVIRSADMLLVHGEIYRSRIAQMNVPADRILVIPLLHLFLGFSSQKTAVEAASATSFENGILFFGRIEKYKGVEILLESYQLLLQNPDLEQRIPPLRLAGSSSYPQQFAGDFPSSIDWRDHFIEDTEAIELFGTCSLVVLPYIDGTQSAVIPSAYYFRKPVIATRVGALPEYVVEGETGLIVEPGDPEALAQAISSIIYDESALKRMGTAGREWYDKQRELELNALRNMYRKFSAN
jgi:glycosyltransferase involved in cell wall biosynthesis